MNTITSMQNPTVKRMRQLTDRKGRQEQGLLLVEGEKMILEALSCGLTPSEALIDEAHTERFADMIDRLEESGARVYAVRSHIIDALGDTRTTQRAIASFTPPTAFARGEEPDTIVALDGVQDPGNVGTIWRTADAAGFGGILLGLGCADPLSPKVQRAAMGSGFRLPWREEKSLAEALIDLQTRGYRVTVSCLNGTPHPARGYKKRVLVIGSEGHGASDAVLDTADEKWTLPMRGGAESLNAAVAAGIMLYEMAEELDEEENT